MLSQFIVLLGTETLHLVHERLVGAGESRSRGRENPQGLCPGRRVADDLSQSSVRHWLVSTTSWTSSPGLLAGNADQGGPPVRVCGDPIGIGQPREHPRWPGGRVMCLWRTPMRNFRGPSMETSICDHVFGLLWRRVGWGRQSGLARKTSKARYPVRCRDSPFLFP